MSAKKKKNQVSDILFYLTNWSFWSFLSPKNVSYSTNLTNYYYYFFLEIILKLNSLVELQTKLSLKKILKFSSLEMQNSEYLQQKQFLSIKIDFQRLLSTWLLDFFENMIWSFNNLTLFLRACRSWVFYLVHFQNTDWWVASTWAIFKCQI
jgi:hypothetical protein